MLTIDKVYSFQHAIFLLFMYIFFNARFTLLAGGILIMTGDVLPCFDASKLVLPDDSSCIITVPITLDIASNHGVIVASKIGINDGYYSLNLVDNLLQKPSLPELQEHQAIAHDGRTLLDTGVIAARGKAWEDVLRLASSSKKMISKLVCNGQEASINHMLVIHTI